MRILVKVCLNGAWKHITTLEWNIWTRDGTSSFRNGKISSTRELVRIILTSFVFLLLPGRVLLLPGLNRTC